MKWKEPVSNWQAFWLVTLTFAGTAIVFVLSGVPLSRVEWLEVLKTGAGAFTAGIAYLALRNWQRQDRAKREAEFLDSLVEATHTYIAEMSAPTTMLEMTMCGFRGYMPLDGDDLEARGAIKYIEAHGLSESKRMVETLDAVRDSVIKLDSLSAKGQVFQFDDYAPCRVAVANLTLQFRRLEVFAVTVGSSSWNWENPIVRNQLQRAITTDADEIRSILASCNISVLEFAKQTYWRLYGKGW